MKHIALPTAEALAGTLAKLLRPPPIVTPAQWATDHLELVDGPKSGHKWDPSEAPYLVEILDRISLDDPCNRISVRKPAQVGFTQALTAAMGYVATVSPGPSMAVFPTLALGDDFNRQKFDPAVRASPLLRRAITQADRRSGRSSTQRLKLFPGGFLTLTGANSTADLRMKTIQFMLADEIDEWEQDLNGQGDPMEMVDGRQKAYHGTGEFKKLEGSTPTIQGQSRIDDAFEAGDQRYYHVPCPDCGEYQRLVLGTGEVWGLKFSKTWPHGAHYVCRYCGVVIEHYQKREIVNAGRWIPDRPEPGRHPSYHIDALLSLVSTWDRMAAAFLAAHREGTTQAKKKGFTNIWLGESYKMKGGDPPDWKLLMARRGTYQPHMVPAGAEVLTAGADIQQDGIYYEVVAWGPGLKSWSIDVGFLAGSTAERKGPVWEKLAQVFNRQYPNAHGGRQRIAMGGVDSGYLADNVYAFVRGRPNAEAVKGISGFGQPPVSTATTKEANKRGRKKRGGVPVWQVGTWDLKIHIYDDLKLTGTREGEERDPAGYCQFTDQLHDEFFFQQLTAETRVEVTTKKGPRSDWAVKGANHYLDCRVYATAMLAHPDLIVDSFDEREWALLARKNRERAAEQADLEKYWLDPTADLAAPVDSEPKTETDTAPPSPAPAAPQPRPRAGGTQRRSRGDGVTRTRR